MVQKRPPIKKKKEKEIVLPKEGDVKWSRSHNKKNTSI